MQLRLKEDGIVEKRSLIFGYVFPQAHHQINSQQEFHLIYKYLQKKEIIKTKVIVPIHIRALNKLQNIKKQKLWQKGELKNYYSEISTIIREYTELRFGFNALELPTFDILSKL